jgi:hypothetical protein
MRKKNPTKAPEIPKEVKIASLVNAYELQEHTINHMVYAFGARFDNAVIDFEIFEKLTIRKKFRNYRELYVNRHSIVTHHVHVKRTHPGVSV